MKLTRRQCKRYLELLAKVPKVIENLSDPWPGMTEAEFEELLELIRLENPAEFRRAAIVALEEMAIEQDKPVEQVVAEMMAKVGDPGLN